MSRMMVLESLAGTPLLIGFVLLSNQVLPFFVENGVLAPHQLSVAQVGEVSVDPVLFHRFLVLLEPRIEEDEFLRIEEMLLDSEPVLIEEV